MKRIKNRIICCVALGAAALTGLTACGPNMNKVKEEAEESISRRNYQAALKCLLTASDSKLEENDSLMLLLSEAYYGLTLDSEYIPSKETVDMDFTPDGKRVAFTDFKTGDIYVYRYPEMVSDSIVSLPGDVFGMDFSPSGKEVATAMKDGKVLIYDFATRRVVKELSGHTNCVRTVAFINDSLLASGGNDQNVIAWNLATGKELAKESPHNKNVKSIKVSKNGKYMVSASNDGSAVIWEIQADGVPQERRRVVHGDNYVNDIAISPDNETLATVSGDGYVKLWDRKSGILNMEVNIDDAGASVDFSPNGKTLIVGGHRFVHFIDLEKGIHAGKMPAKNSTIWSVKFINDNDFAFVDQSYFYHGKLLSGKALIEAARSWLKEHPSTVANKQDVEPA